MLLEKKEGVRTNVQLQSVKSLPPLPRGVKPWKEWSRDYLTKVRKAKAGFELVGWFSEIVRKVPEVLLVFTDIRMCFRSDRYNEEGQRMLQDSRTDESVAVSSRRRFYAAGHDNVNVHNGEGRDFMIQLLRL